MNMRIRRWVFAVILGVVVAGCSGSQGADDVAGVEAEVRSEAPITDEAVEEDDGSFGDLPLRRSSGEVRPWQPQTLGNQVILAFNAGDPGVPGEPCSSEYAAELIEQDSDVVRVRVSGGRWFVADPDLNFGCTDEGFSWAVSVELAEPLGDRQLIVNGDDRNSLPREPRLAPTWLPDDFITYFSRDGVPTSRAEYGLPGKDYGSLSVHIAPVGTRSDRVDFLAEREGFETLDILAPGDGGVVWEPRGPTLGFESERWYYEISTDINMTREDLLTFARSFQPAIEIDPAELSEGLRAEPVFPSEPQPGNFANPDG